MSVDRLTVRRILTQKILDLDSRLITLGLIEDMSDAIASELGQTYLSHSEAADLAGISSDTLYRHVKEGRIEAHPINPKAKRKTHRYLRHDVLNYKASFRARSAKKGA